MIRATDPTATPSGAPGIRVGDSAIEGHGLFAARAFAPAERIRRVNVIREVTADTPLRDDLGERADHCDYRDHRVFLIGSPDRHLNHSCDPNAYLAYAGDACFIVARRPIATARRLVRPAS